MAEKYYSWSGYNYVMGSPVRMVDPRGDTTKVTTGGGIYLFSLDDGKAEVVSLTAKELYDQGVQWFSPEADNYMPIIDINPKISTMEELKHFSWDQIADFSDEDRFMLSYRQGGRGDWKQSARGADGYFLVTVDGKPYWADAIGQIPFAVNFYKNSYSKTGNKAAAIFETLIMGRKYGEGKLFGGAFDDSNHYDIYFILRGAKWALHKYERLSNGNLIKTNYSPANLGKPITNEDVLIYGIK